MAHGNKYSDHDKAARREPETKQPMLRRQRDDDVDDELFDRYGRAAFCTELRQGSRRRG